MACCVYVCCVAGYGSPVRVAGYLGLPSQRERDSSLGKEEGTPRDSSPLNLSFPRSRYPLREMNSLDERIWRTVIVSVGAAGISRGGLGPMAQVARKSFQGFSSLLSMLDEGVGG